MTYQNIQQDPDFQHFKEVLEDFPKFKSYLNTKICKRNSKNCSARFTSEASTELEKLANMFKPRKKLWKFINQYAPGFGKRCYDRYIVYIKAYNFTREEDERIMRYVDMHENKSFKWSGIVKLMNEPSKCTAKQVQNRYNHLKRLKSAKYQEAPITSSQSANSDDNFENQDFLYDSNIDQFMNHDDNESIF